MNYPNVPYPGAQRPMGQPQQFFPMPQGNVYTIERPEEISTVPCGTGVSVALLIHLATPTAPAIPDTALVSVPKPIAAQISLRQGGLSYVRNFQ